LSCFFFSNHNDLNTVEILTKYRYQTAVEIRFKLIKDPIFFGPLNIKRNGRMEAFRYLALFALVL
jgi:transposase